MAPGTNTGAAHPVAMGGEMDAVMKQKVENDAAAYLRSICAKRGRNSALAETAVRQSKSFTEREALDQHLIDLVAPNESDLLAHARRPHSHALRRQHADAAHRGRGDRGIREARCAERIISAIADPNIALILLVLGALGIYVEFTSPGLIAPGSRRAPSWCCSACPRSRCCPSTGWARRCWFSPSRCSFWRRSSPSHGVLGVGGAVAHGARAPSC